MGPFTSDISSHQHCVDGGARTGQVGRGAHWLLSYQSHSAFKQSSCPGGSDQQDGTEGTKHSPGSRFGNRALAGVRKAALPRDPGGNKLQLNSLHKDVAQEGPEMVQEWSKLLAEMEMHPLNCFNYLARGRTW